METTLTRDTRFAHTALTALTALGVLAVACGQRPAPGLMPASPPTDLEAAAAALYEAYGSALATPRRGAIAGFYHQDGALVVLNGVSRRLTRAELEAKYQGAWSPPAFFAWDALAFDPIGPAEVIVTGGFRWQSAGRPDTVPYIYAALLVAVDSGLAIIFEHETLRPSP